MNIIKNLLKILPDKLYLQLMYFKHFRKFINFNNPKSFNEKIQFLKLKYRSNELTEKADKYKVKQYVSQLIGNEYVIPTLGVWNTTEEINFDELPEKFVLKCNNDSGGVVICKDKQALNIEETKKFLNSRLNNNGFWYGREWPYKNIKPCIIAEKYMENNGQNELIDYKFFCFNGQPKVVLVCSERFASNNMCKTYFDEDWNLLNIMEANHRTDKEQKKPQSFEKMKTISQKLAKDMPFVRIDFYEIEGKLYFGEITFFPASGLEKFKPEKWNNIFGDMIDISKYK